MKARQCDTFCKGHSPLTWLAFTQLNSYPNRLSCFGIFCFVFFFACLSPLPSLLHFILNHSPAFLVLVIPQHLIFLISLQHCTAVPLTLHNMVLWSVKLGVMWTAQCAGPATGDTSWSEMGQLYARRPPMATTLGTRQFPPVKVS